jgi:hypothetical protein
MNFRERVQENYSQLEGETSVWHGIAVGSAAIGGNCLGLRTSGAVWHAMVDAARSSIADELVLRATNAHFLLGNALEATPIDASILEYATGPQALFMMGWGLGAMSAGAATAFAAPYVARFGRALYHTMRENSSSSAPLTQD